MLDNTAESYGLLVQTVAHLISMASQNRAGTAGGCEPPDLSAGHCTLVLCKSGIDTFITELGLQPQVMF